MRQRVRESLQKALNSGIGVALVKNDVENALGSATVDAHALAATIEQAMYRHFAEMLPNAPADTPASCGDAYREKFRTLYSNLRNADNVRRVLSGDIDADRLVQMSSDELASDELKHIRQEVMEDKLRGSVLTEEQAAVVLKHVKPKMASAGTNRPGSSAEKETDGTVDDANVLARNRGSGAVQDVAAMEVDTVGEAESSVLPLEATSQDSVNKQMSDSNGSVGPIRRASADAVREPVVVMSNSASTKPLASQQPVEDFLLAKVDTHRTSVLSLGRTSPKRKQAGEADTASTPPAKVAKVVSDEADVPAAGRVVWSGRLEMLNVGSVGGKARQGQLSYL